MAFPLTVRELAQQGRHWRLYWPRMIGALFVAAYCGVSLWLAGGAQGAGTAPQAALLMLSITHSFQFMVILFGVPAMSAGIIAREKEDRTLSLLLTTGLPARDIIFSKFLAVLLPVLLLLVSALPFTAFAVALGGFSVVQIVSQFVLLSLAAASLCAVGVLSSTVFDNERTASSFTLLALILWAIVMGFVDVWLSDAGYDFSTSLLRAAVLPPVGRGLTTVNSATATGTSSVTVLGASWRLLAILPALVIAFGIAAGALWLATKLLPGQAMDKPEKERKHTSRRHPRRRRLTGPRLGPVGELISALLRSTETRAYMRVLRNAFAILLALMLFMIVAVSPQQYGIYGLAIILGLVVAVHVCYDSCSAVASVRGAGALTDVLLLGQGDRTVVRALFLACFRREAIHLPSLYMVSYAIIQVIPSAGSGPPSLPADALTKVLHLAIPVVPAVGQLALIASLSCLASIWPRKPKDLAQVTGLFFIALHLAGAWTIAQVLSRTSLEFLGRAGTGAVASVLMVVPFALFAAITYVLIPRVLLWFVAGNFRYRASRMA